jgi:hypothetical protein
MQCLGPGSNAGLFITFGTMQAIEQQRQAQRTILQNKVDARNKVNALALQYREDLVEILKPYLGKKIRKVSGYGGWVKALEPALDDLAARYREQGCRTYCTFCITSFWAELSVSYETGPHSCDYVKQQISIGKCQTEDSHARGKADGVLTELDDFQPGDFYQTDWTADVVVHLQNQVRQAREELRELEAKLRRFD